MRKLITAGAMAAAILAAGGVAGTAGATPLTSAGTLPAQSQSSSPVQRAACWCGPYRCACRRYRYYRPYRYYRGYRYRY